MATAECVTPPVTLFAESLGGRDDIGVNFLHSYLPHVQCRVQTLQKTASPSSINRPNKVDVMRGQGRKLRGLQRPVNYVKTLCAELNKLVGGFWPAGRLRP